MRALLLALGLLAPASLLAQTTGFTLSLAQAVDRARSQSPLRASAVAAAEGAATAASLAGRLPNPLIDVRAENLAPGSALPPDRDIFAVVSQPIELGGKRGTRRDLAGADRELSALLLRTVDRQIALDTVRAYMRAVRARDVLATLAAQRDGVDTLVATMRRRVDEGFAPESDLLRFEAEAARMTTETSRMQIELTRALTELGAILGMAAPQPAALVTPATARPPAVEIGVMETAIDARADVRLAGLRVDRARLAAQLEHQRRLPDPAVSGGYKRTQGQNTAVAGVVVAVPLFDRNGQSRAVADAAVKSAEADRAAIRERAAAEARAALSAAAMLSDNLSRIDRDLLAPAEGVRRAAQAMFREGATDVLKLVDAERIYADVRREALSLAVDAYVAAIEARFAVGQEEIP